MQPLLVVNLGDEAIDPAPGVTEVCERLSVDLFGLERLHEALGLGVVEGIAGPAHDGNVVFGEPPAIGDGGVLHAELRELR